MKKLIKSVDLLVTPFEFNIKDQEGATSLLGGFSTIIIMTFTMFYFLGTLRKNLSNLDEIYAGSQSEQVTNQFKLLENTLVAAELSFDKGKIMSNLTEISQYFNLTGQFVQQYRKQQVQGYTRNYTNLNKQRCDRKTVEQFNFNPQAMTDQQEENLICFDGYFHLQGQFYDPYFSYFRIMVQVCNNATTNNTCKSLEEINRVITSGIKIDLFIQGARIRSNYNESSPAFLYSTNIYWLLNSQTADNEDIYIETIALDLKKTYFLYDLFGIESFEKIFNGQGVKKQERRQESTSIQSNAVLASFYLRESTEFQYYFVIQQDYSIIIFQAISEATGLCLAILEIARIFYKYYNSHYTFEMIMNSVYLFNIKNKLKQQDDENQEFDKQLDEILHFQISFTFISYLFYEAKRIVKKLNCFSSTNKKNPSISNQEKELIISSIAKKKIEEDLDITNILKKLYEVDCLKLLLLDDNQLMLFNQICKPVFTDQTQKMMKDNEKMVKEVQNGTLSLLQRTTSLQNDQQQIIRDETIKDAEASIIPLGVRLANLAWFFKSQLKLPNKLLFQNYQIIKSNNTNLDKKLLLFTKQTNCLEKLLTRMESIHIQTLKKADDQKDQNERKVSEGNQFECSGQLLQNEQNAGQLLDQNGEQPQNKSQSN